MTSKNSTKKDLREAVDAILEGMTKMFGVQDKKIDKLDHRVDKLDHKVDKLETNISFIKRGITDIKADLSDTPSKKQFENLKQKVERKYAH